MKEVHTEQKRRRGMYAYDHYLSRKGYANLEQELVSDLYTLYYFSHDIFDYVLIFNSLVCSYM